MKKSGHSSEGDHRSDEYRKFENLTRRLVTVPKGEAQKKARGRKAKPSR